MKLYATITSERASKGQGGNNVIKIILKDSERKSVAEFSFWPPEAPSYQYHLFLDGLDRNRVDFEDITIKGKKQKGNFAGYCKCTGDESMQNTKYCKDCGKENIPL